MYSHACNILRGIVYALAAGIHAIFTKLRVTQQTSKGGTNSALIRVEKFGTISLIINDATFTYNMKLSLRKNVLFF